MFFIICVWIEISAAVTGRSSFKRFASRGLTMTRHTRPAQEFVRVSICTNSRPVPPPPPPPAAASRMSNNRHQEIKCLHILQKNKRHIVFQLFLESLWNIQNAFLKIRICYITCTKIMLCVFSSSLKFFFCVFFFFKLLVMFLCQLSK